MNKRIFTSESVTEGHPDKVCDQISDAVLDEILKYDPQGRVACETFTTTGSIFVMGEISTSSYVDIQQIARKTVKEIGYDSSDTYFDGNTCAIMTMIHDQSSDIAMGVNKSYETKENKTSELELGAGDQGMMFGYACDDNENYMPAPISIAHKLTYNLAKLRKDKVLDYLRPDGKSQVTVAYDENNKPVHIDTIVISTQHSASVDVAKIKKDLIDTLIPIAVPMNMVDDSTRILVNPTGRFVIGGPMGDTGLTGRKIIVDTYGGMGRHGGGAFSGKDPTKVDRSASYAARYIAKNIVAAGLAKRCEIQISYAIGVARPTSVRIDTFGTGIVPEYKLEAVVQDIFDLRPGGIISMLDLRRPIYKQTASYGHFGRDDIMLPWEQLDKIEALQQSIK